MTKCIQVRECVAENREEAYRDANFPYLLVLPSSDRLEVRLTFIQGDDWFSTGTNDAAQDLAMLTRDAHQNSPVLLR